jgi:hypothetical protein
VGLDSHCKKVPITGLDMDFMLKLAALHRRHFLRTLGTICVTRSRMSGLSQHTGVARLTNGQVSGTNCIRHHNLSGLEPKPKWNRPALLLCGDPTSSAGSTLVD